MNTRTRRALLGAITLSGAMGVIGCATMQSEEAGQQVRLWGSNEVPPVTTLAYGTGVVYITGDRAVTVNVSAIDMVATAAHIHEGAAGANGPAIVPLSKISERDFVAPPNAKLT